MPKADGLHDRDVGWVRFGYRDYDPLTARFTAKDPIGYAGGDNDLYGYCVDDPVNMVDPEGLEAEPAEANSNFYDTEVEEIHEYYWTITPSTNACDKCQAMAGLRFPEEPERPHLNCKCFIKKNRLIPTYDTRNDEEKVDWTYTGGYLVHRSGKAWKAVSGPYGNGAAPSGLYAITGAASPVGKNHPKQASFCDKEGNCWWVPIKPDDPDTGRSGLGIHPDGNGEGTAGCIGVKGKDTSELYQMLVNSSGERLRIK